MKLCMLLLILFGYAESGLSKRAAQSTPEPATLSHLAAGVHQQTVTLPSGASLRYTVSIPPQFKPNGNPLIVALHWGGKVTPFYGGYFMKYLVIPAFGRSDNLIVAPDALDGKPWNADVNEEAVIWLTKTMIRSYRIDQKKILVVGFSMGAAGAWYIGGRHQDLFTAVVPVADNPIGDDLKWTIPVYVIHSKKDELFPLERTEKFVEKVRATGGTVELRVLETPTHHEAEKYIRPLAETRSWLKQVWK